MTLTDLLALLSGQHWLGLIAAVVLLLRKWSSPDSKFPITINPRWQPVITMVGGLAYGLVSSLQQGTAPSDAMVAMVIAAGVGGFGDAFLMAIFDHDNAPNWARAIVFIFDDVTGGGTMKRVLAHSLPPVSMGPGLPSKPPPPNMKRGRVGFHGILALLMVMTVSCGSTIVIPPNTPTDVTAAVSCVATALLSGGSVDPCVARYGPALVNDAIQILFDSKFVAAHPEHPELAAKMKTSFTPPRAP